MSIFVEHWGDNLQFYPNFALFSTLGDMNLDHDFFQVSKLSEDLRVRSSLFTKRRKTLFLETCAQMHIAHQSQIIGGMQMQTILKL